MLKAMRPNGLYLVNRHHGRQTVARWSGDAAKWAGGTGLFFDPFGSQFGEGWCDVIRGPLDEAEAKRLHAAMFGDLDFAL